MSLSKAPFVEAGNAIGELVQEKNNNYGSAYDKAQICMEIFFPKGIPPESMGDAQLMYRLLEKFGRIAANKNAYGEDPWKDIAGTALTGVIRSKRDRAHARQG